MKGCSLGSGDCYVGAYEICGVCVVKSCFFFYSGTVYELLAMMCCVFEMWRKVGWIREKCGIIQ